MSRPTAIRRGSKTLDVGAADPVGAVLVELLGIEPADVVRLEHLRVERHRDLLYGQNPADLRSVRRVWNDVADPRDPSERRRDDPSSGSSRSRSPRLSSSPGWLRPTTTRTPPATASTETCPRPTSPASASSGAPRGSSRSASRSRTSRRSSARSEVNFFLNTDRNRTTGSGGYDYVIKVSGANGGFTRLDRHSAASGFLPGPSTVPSLDVGRRPDDRDRRRRPRRARDLRLPGPGRAGRTRARSTPTSLRTSARGPTPPARPWRCSRRPGHLRRRRTSRLRTRGSSRARQGTMSSRVGNLPVRLERAQVDVRVQARRRPVAGLQAGRRRTAASPAARTSSASARRTTSGISTGARPSRSWRVR